MLLLFGGCSSILRILVKTTFFILINQCLTIVGLRFLFSLKIYFNAKSRLQEFSGLQGRRFPGQESPRPPFITPWRPSLPPDFSNEWSRIGSKRSYKTVTILVQPAEETNGDK